MEWRIRRWDDKPCETLRRNSRSMSMASHSLTPRRIKAAFAVGVIADILQLPVSLSLLAGFVPAEGLDAAIDVVAAVVVNWLLGFHWALLPSFALKLVPILDVAPTWTACVAYVALQRRPTASHETMIASSGRAQVAAADSVE